MTLEEIQKKTRMILAEEFEIEEQEITPDAPIRKVLNLDSLDIVDIVVLADRHFNVKISAKDLETINTFNDFYTLLMQRLKEQ